jgi:hypothetical protein
MSSLRAQATLAAAAARTREALWDVIGQSRYAVTASECANCLTHCGYQGANAVTAA